MGTLLGVILVVVLVAVGAFVNWIDPPNWLPARPLHRWLIVGVLMVIVVTLTVVNAANTPSTRKDPPTDVQRALARQNSGKLNQRGRWLIESSIGLANVTRGDTEYVSEVEANVGDVLKAQVFVRNREVSHDVEQLRVKIGLPSVIGPSVAVTSTATCERCFEVADGARVSASAPVRLQLITGSTTWRSGSRNGSVDKSDSEAIVTSPDGALWGQLPADPQYDALTVTVLMRVGHVA